MNRTGNDASNNSYIFACISWRGNVFTQPLPSAEKGIHLTEPLICNDGLHIGYRHTD
jgi:hypothetical protein